MSELESEVKMGEEKKLKWEWKYTHKVFFVSCKE